MGSSSSKVSRALPKSKPSTRPTTGPLDGLGRGKQKPPPASEAKGQAIREDGMDPQLLANLTRLGPVKVDHGMKGLKPMGANASRILEMQKQSETEAQMGETKRNRIQAPSLFDALTRLQGAKDDQTIERLAEEYNLDVRELGELGKTVNVPTPDETTARTVVDEDGAEVVLKTAKWATFPALKQSRSV
ncbi:hypothetical protein BDM02DRAFT_2168406 [Thelephora ganbajun]|uniref:Uncharacterized protein n=1 Tax=Thelephora ganbajun TaxID=370292 RepID=A0ACB6ZTH5_THEGA|nr:hypothetical protein BDM02DRAFT_2168406 [Thelephora ganbajun]